MLEMKQKQGASQKKRSLRMTKADAEDLIRGKYEVLLKYEEDFAKECYGLMHYKCYRPKTIVEYNRKALLLRKIKFVSPLIIKSFPLKAVLIFSIPI